MKTIIANWVPCDGSGHPAWINANINPLTNITIPLLTGLTLLPRRVWLHEPTGKGICINCGDRVGMIIKSCEFQSPGKLENEQWDDPHVIYYHEDNKRKSDRTLNLLKSGMFKMDRPWPKTIQRMIEADKLEVNTKSSSLLIVGFVTKDANHIDVWERILENPTIESVSEIVQSLIIKWNKEGWRMERRIGQSKELGSASISAIRPQVEDQVSSKISELLCGGEEAWQKAAKEAYQPMMESIAKSLSPGFTIAAVERRSQIADTIPDMRIKNEPEKKSDKKKGKDKWAQQQITLKI